MVEEAKAEGDEVPPVPIGMYVDGVPYLKRGHFVALWVYNLLTGVRHVIVVLKKRPFANVAAVPGVHPGTCSPILLGPYQLHL